MHPNRVAVHVGAHSVTHRRVTLRAIGTCIADKPTKKICQFHLTTDSLITMLTHWLNAHYRGRPESFTMMVMLAMDVRLSRGTMLEPSVHSAVCRERVAFASQDSSFIVPMVAASTRDGNMSTCADVNWLR